MKLPWDRRNWRIGLTVSLVAVALAAAGARSEAARVVHPPSAAALPQNSAGRMLAPNMLSPQAALALVQGERDKYWLNAKDVTIRSVPELFAQRQDELEHGLRFSRILEGDPRKKEIALTFDDGPHPGYTPQLLAVLKRYNVKATFFVVGEQAEKNPELIRDEIAAGDSVGNHTYDHVSLVKIPQDYVSTEIKACGEVLDSITDKTPHLFRPPGGVYDPRIAETAEALGYTTVLWTDDPGDYASPGTDVILSRTLDKASPGGIILLHDGIQQTIDVLPQIIQTLRNRGYKFVTVDQMLAERAAARREVASVPAGKTVL